MYTDTVIAIRAWVGLVLRLIKHRPQLREVTTETRTRINMTRVTFFFHLFALSQLMQTSWCHFEFQLRLDAIVDLKDCQDALELIHPPCETYIPKFCLRDAREPGTRSRDLSDCPLGSGRNWVLEDNLVQLADYQSLNRLFRHSLGR